MEINRRTFLRLGGMFAVEAILGAGVEESVIAQEPDPQYTEAVFEGCAYQGTEIADMTLGLWKMNRSGSAWMLQEGIPPANKTPQEIIDTLSTWKGRNLWQGYDSSDPSGLGGVRKPQATLRFTLGYNKNFDVYDDRIEIEFGKTANDEGYVMAQSSSKTFGDSQGNHVGDHHLCVISAIPKEHIDELISWFTPDLP